jgi:hypothetical protein
MGAVGRCAGGNGWGVFGELLGIALDPWIRKAFQKAFAAIDRRSIPPRNRGGAN